MTLIKNPLGVLADKVEETHQEVEQEDKAMKR